MDDRCENTGISIYFQCRVLASKNNENFRSRESAAEYFGVSVSSMANYERGITVPPLDLVMMMADEYHAPQLKNLYCLNQCPLGKGKPISGEVKTLEAVTVGIVAKLDNEDIEDMRRELLDIAEDGRISPDEEEDFRKVTQALDKLAVSISELRLIKEKLLRKGGGVCGY
jgi:transcriptional regulator with XRE-family HTH domain|nr:MAG TPA: regulatory protein [Caudoviricetes sp.]